MLLKGLILFLGMKESILDFAWCVHGVPIILLLDISETSSILLFDGKRRNLHMLFSPASESGELVHK